MLARFCVVVALRRARARFDDARQLCLAAGLRLCSLGELRVQPACCFTLAASRIALHALTLALTLHQLSRSPFPLSLYSLFICSLYPRTIGVSGSADHPGTGIETREI